MAAEIGPFGISPNPDGKVGVNIIKPGGKGLGIGRMTIHPGGDHRAACRIMPTVVAVGVRHTACGVSVPLEIGAVLAKRSAQSDRS